MNATDADFHRLLPIAFPGVTFNPTTRCFTPVDGGWRLHLGLPGHLPLTSVRIPTLDVTFHFETADPDSVTTRFLRHFMKGGG
mgnify:CR=1 FL=1